MEIIHNNKIYNLETSERLSDYCQRSCDLLVLYKTLNNNYFLIRNYQKYGYGTEWVKEMIKSNLNNEEIVAFLEKAGDRKALEQFLGKELETA